MRRRTFLDDSGQWSGGGRVFLSNFRFAAKRHQILAGHPDDVPLVPRNVPVARVWRGPYLLVPQNAWPWNPVSSGWREGSTVVGLRLASEYYARRATSLLRISDAVPRRLARSPLVLHNVLDEGFEVAQNGIAGATAPETSRSFVSVGSVHSYRNLTSLLGAYEDYRSGGGRLGLVVVGAPGSAALGDAIRSKVSQLAGARLIDRSLPRESVLKMLADATAVVLPSRVEASPLSALEAAVLNTQVLLSDIPGHRGILKRYSDNPAGGGWFEPNDRPALARLLAAAEAGEVGDLGVKLRTAEERLAARESWSAEMAAWCESVLG